MDHMVVSHTYPQQNTATRHAFPVFLWGERWVYHQHKHILYVCVNFFPPSGIHCIPSSILRDRYYGQGSLASLNENLLHIQHRERCCGEKTMEIYCLSHQARIHCHTLLTLLAHLISLCCISVVKANKHSFLRRQQLDNLFHRYHLKSTIFIIRVIYIYRKKPFFQVSQALGSGMKVWYITSLKKRGPYLKVGFLRGILFESGVLSERGSNWGLR